MPISFKEYADRPISDQLFEERKGDPPCRAECPAGVNAAAYVGLIAQGRFEEALDVIRQRMPFPGICGRVCHHPCENECSRGKYDEPVSIAALKRAAADYGQREKPDPVVKNRFVHRVAVVGSGPAGLTAAYDLTRKGYQVTVYERESKPGGMIRAAIPFYRLPEEVVDRDINNILDTGIEVKLNTEVGRDVTVRELEMYHDAVLIAVGTQKSAVLNIEGTGSDRVFWGVDFLRRVKSEYPPEIGQKVLIIGGGNVAIDAGRTALRLGAESVTLACLESRSEMPAHDWEVAAAVEEGLVVKNSLGPVRVVTGPGGEVEGMTMVAVASVFDADGRFNPSFVENSERLMEADTVIIAIGQTADLYFLEEVPGIEPNRRRLIDTDPVTFETGRLGMFACGDVVSGPKSIVESVNAGHEAAESVHRYLCGRDLGAGRVEEKQVLPLPEGMPVFDYERHVPRKPEAEQRKEDFREEQYGLTREQAIAEAKRCLNCGNCFICGGECTIHITGGICPVIRCNKSSVNGPCGGSAEGHCEIGENDDCGWQLIFEMLQKAGRVKNLESAIAAKDWSYLENEFLEGSAVPRGAVASDEMLRLVEEKK